MYKAVNNQTSDEIVILDDKWRDQVALLRSLDRQDILVCQGCQQPVRVRAGPIRRWHFAHKHLQNCLYGHESPALLDARAVLYRWLVSKFGETVRLEEDTGSQYLPRPVDCWVNRDGVDFAYWIIHSGMKAETRNEIKTGFKQLKVSVNWIFTIEMLREVKSTPGVINLSTTGRKFIQLSEYDTSTAGYRYTGRGSLHYLDPSNGTLTTFRSLHNIHAPHLFAGKKMSAEISQVLVSPKTGEIVYPGEYERLQRCKQEKTQAAGKVTTTLKRYNEEMGRSSKQNDEDVTRQDELSYWEETEATCVFCGNKTKDYWYLNRANGMCKCRDCYRLGKY